MLNSVVAEFFVKYSKKLHHCLFVEEESYNWAPARTGASKRMLVLMAVLILGSVVILTQLR
jgi:hypothetical protein